MTQTVAIAESAVIDQKHIARRTRPWGEKLIKLVIWDLDNTLWDGILVEDRTPALFPGRKELLHKIDSWGVLQSIASRNDLEAATAHMKRLGILDYFLALQVSWSPKSTSIAIIAEALDISLDHVLFVDDQDFEREEVRYVYPMVTTLGADRVEELHNQSALCQTVPASDSRSRRLRYLDQEKRLNFEREFSGSPEQFLKELNLQLRIDRATLTDLERIAELIGRANQLNSTGHIYSTEELRGFVELPGYSLIIVGLKDKFGDYGQIGVALIDISERIWVLKLIIVSCRVISRGVGPILLSHIVRRANEVDATVEVEFLDTGRNRPMKMALMMAGFTQNGARGGMSLFARDRNAQQSIPRNVTIVSSW